MIVLQEWLQQLHNCIQKSGLITQFGDQLNQGE